MALRCPQASLLVQALLAQHRYPSGYGDSLQLLAESFRGERVGPLRVTRTFEMCHFQRDLFGHRRILHGSRNYGSRVGIGNVNGLSPNLPSPTMDRPHTIERSRGWACVETVRSGSREPSYLTLQLYTSVRASATGSRLLVSHRLPGEA